MSAPRSFYKVFVGNLPWTIHSRELKQYFAQFGHVNYASVIFDKATGLSKGYGFVTFSTSGGVDGALGKPNHMLEGSNLIIQPTI